MKVNHKAVFCSKTEIGFRNRCKIRRNRQSPPIPKNRRLKKIARKQKVSTAFLASICYYGGIDSKGFYLHSLFLTAFKSSLCDIQDT